MSAEEVDLWGRAHDALREFHRLRGLHANRSSVDKAWHAYQRAKVAAKERSGSLAATNRADTSASRSHFGSNVEQDR